MNQKEATQKAGTTSAEMYEIPFESANTVKSLVGKTIKSKDANNKNEIKIVEWIGQNYVVCTNGTDWNSVPAMWVVKNIVDGKIAVS